MPFESNMKLNSLITFAEKLANARVLCIGDLILDTFNHGNVDRISPERPVPVFQPKNTIHIPGGAANVAKNVTSLGGMCTLLGLIGKDEAGSILADLLEHDSLLNISLIISDSKPTTQKIRFTAAGQHLLRLDNETSDALAELEVSRLLDITRLYLPSNDVLILSDYAKGLLGPSTINSIIKLANDMQKPIIVDPKGSDFLRYCGASIITPNAFEAEKVVGFPIHSDDDVELAGSHIMEYFNISAVLITRGARGMSLMGKSLEPLHIESDALEVFDVVGAGDTVIAALASAISIGAGITEAAIIANLAAGLVVAKKDTATVSRKELLYRLIQLTHDHPRLDRSPLLALCDLAIYVAARRAEGKRIGFTNGVFDLVHSGHVSLLRFARRHCDVLIVGINSDESVRRLGKGSNRPINSDVDRAEIIGAFDMVDATVIFDEDTPLDLIKIVKPNTLIKGSDYTVESVVGASFVQEYGGDVLLAPMEVGRSSTQIIRLIENSPS